MPIPINIEDLKISILSYAGPDRSISLDAIKKAERLKSRRYRNRRLGDYLKELQLSEVVLQVFLPFKMSYVRMVQPLP